MRKGALIKFVFTISVLLLAHTEVYADSPITFDFIYSTEFKDAEIARLLALPPEVVPIMSIALEQMDDRDQHRHRLVSCLLRKLSQSDLALSESTRMKAIAALKGKSSSVNKSKQDLILMIESDPTGSRIRHLLEKSKEERPSGNSFRDLDLTHTESDNITAAQPVPQANKTTIIVISVLLAGFVLNFFKKEFKKH